MRDHRPGRLLAGTRQRFDRIWREHFTGEAGAIDLAAIEHADEAAAAVVFLAGAGPEKWGRDAGVRRYHTQGLDDL